MKRPDNRKWMMVIAFLLIFALVFTVACSPADEPEEVEEPVDQPEEPTEEEEPEEVAFATEPPPSGFNDGTYRGTYGDRGDQQVSVQFTLTDGVISNVGYRHLYYAATDFDN